MKKQKEIIEKSSKIENDSKKKKKEKKRKRSFSSERLSPKYDASLERPRNDSVTTEMDVKNAPQAENGFTERHEEIIRQSKSDIKQVMQDVRELQYLFEKSIKQQRKKNTIDMSVDTVTYKDF